MQHKKVIVIGLLASISLGISYYFYGIFTPYNYFNAKYDLISGKVRVLTYGLPHQYTAVEDQVAAEFGFHYYPVAGCLVTAELMNGVEAYNAVVKDYLEEKNGKDWQEQFNKRMNEELNRVKEQDQQPTPHTTDN